MKAMWMGLMAAALLVSTGCNNKNLPGGPGAKDSDKEDKNHIGLEDNSFKLSPPTFSTHIKQGETKQVDISIKRGKNFDQDVALKFDKLPNGVSVDPSSPAIKKGSDEAKLTVKAAEDAAVGDFVIQVTGHPKEGKDASSELKLTVSKK